MVRKFHIGCSGFFYFHWKGRFYPEDAKPSDFFKYYQSVFDTVEINSTFYRFPKESTMKRMYKSAKEGFLFSVKMNKEITHIRKFRNIEKELEKFYEEISVLKEKLGAVLIQLPPSIKYNEEFLRRIIDALSPYMKFVNAIEFRHISWWNEKVYEKLRDSNLIFTSVSAKGLPDDVICTSHIGYVRFHGISGWYKDDYSEEYLREVLRKINSEDFEEVYVYFNNDFNAYAPKNAITFRDLCSATSL